MESSQAEAVWWLAPAREAMLLLLERPALSGPPDPAELAAAVTHSLPSGGCEVDERGALGRAWIRQQLAVDTEALRAQLQAGLVAKPSKGRSRCLFGRFGGVSDGSALALIKEVGSSEAAVWDRNLAGAIEHLEASRGRTLLMQQLALVTVRCGERAAHLALLTNGLRSDRAERPHVFDLKGHTAGRSVPPLKRTPSTPLKDVEAEDLAIDLPEQAQRAVLVSCAACACDWCGRRRFKGMWPGCRRWTRAILATPA